MSDKETRTVYLDHEPTELYRILKFEGLVGSGGEAKQMIDGGAVTLNGDIETRRRKKVLSGDKIEFEDFILNIELSTHDSK